jgi:uncharacterized membrane protein
MPDRSDPDYQIEIVVGKLLRTGVISAASVVAVGGLIYLWRHGLAHPDYNVFRGEPADLRNLGGIWKDAISFRGRGIIQLGLVLLIATPIARVAFSVYGFARERDYQYVFITLIVLGLLAYSLIGSAG